MIVEATAQRLNENMDMKELTLHPNQLLLDPNNFRFHDVAGYKRVSQAARYGERGVQDRALTLLEGTKSFDMGPLKESIRSNGYIPIEKIVVEEFDVDGNPPTYLIIEGNRRAAALKILLADHKSGAEDIEEDVHKTLENIPVIVVVGGDEERRRFKNTLMAIRHVAGIREWGPYQQAKLVVELYDDEEHAFGPVAQRIGISSREVARRYRASKALQQMEEDEEFSEFADPRLYSFFHEAVSQPKVREWLEFSDETYQAENEENRRLFYELLSPREVEGAMLPPKLQNANKQVRQLKGIVDKEVPMQILADPEQPFEDAVAAAASESSVEEAGLIEHSLGVALQALRRPSVDAWFNPSGRAKELYRDVLRIVENVKAMMEKD